MFAVLVNAPVNVVDERLGARLKSRKRLIDVDKVKILMVASKISAKEVLKVRQRNAKCATRSQHSVAIAHQRYTLLVVQVLEKVRRVDDVATVVLEWKRAFP